MFVCEGGAFDPDVPAGLIIDPHGGWLFRELDDIERQVGRLARPDPKAVIARMLNNLESDFSDVGDPKGAALAGECRALLRIDLQ
jgi:hypothetical protein